MHILLPLDVLNTMKNFNLSVTPVLNRDGKVDFWSASVRQVIKNTGQNYNDYHSGHGKTPEEAVTKLLQKMK